MTRWRLVIAIVALAIGLAVWRWPTSREDAPPNDRHVAAGATSPAATTTRAAAEATAPRAPRHVTRLDGVDARAQIAAAIARAQAARARPAPAPGATAPAPSDEGDGGALHTTIKEAMREVIPELAACYERAVPTLPSPAIDVTTHLTLRGDPDVGTLIDTGGIADAAGRPLPGAFDDCLRGALMSLELPPLAEGDTLEVTYPFAFRSDDDAATGPPTAPPAPPAPPGRPRRATPRPGPPASPPPPRRAG